MKILILIVVLIGVGFFLVGRSVGLQELPETIYVEVEKVVELEPIIKYIKVPEREVIIKEVYIVKEVIKTEYIRETVIYKPWKSKEEFHDWYEAKLPKIRGYLMRFKLKDCDKVAEALQVIAMQEGRAISNSPYDRPWLFNQKIYDRSWNGSETHAAPTVIIGNMYYVIQPGMDDAVLVRLVNRD